MRSPDRSESHPRMYLAERSIMCLFMRVIRQIAGQKSAKMPKSQDKRSAQRANAKLPTFDLMDRKILSALRTDGRLTVNELAAKVGLSQSPCWTRLKRLESSGAIQRYVAILDHKAIGLANIVFVEVTLNKHDD